MYLGPFSSVSRINYKILTSIGALTSTTSVASTSIVNNYQTFYSDVQSYFDTFVEFVKKIVENLGLEDFKQQLEEYYKKIQEKIKAFEIPKIGDVEILSNSFSTIFSYIKKLESVPQYLTIENITKVFDFIKIYSSTLKNLNLDIFSNLQLIFDLLFNESFWELFQNLFQLIQTQGSSIPWTEFTADDFAQIVSVLSEANQKGNLNEVVKRISGFLKDWKPPFDKDQFIRKALYGNTLSYLVENIGNGKLIEAIDEIAKNPTQVAAEIAYDIITDPRETAKAAVDAVVNTLGWFFGG